MSEPETATTNLPTADDLRRWRKERQRLMAQEKAIKRRRAALDKFIEAAQALVGVEGAAELAPAPPAKEQTEASTPPKGSRLRYDRGKTWTATILKVVKSENRGMTYEELREEMLKTHLGERLQQTEKAFYGGVGKLAEKGEIVKHKGRIYSSRAYRQFRRDVDAGLLADVHTPMGGHSSPAKDAIFQFLCLRPQGGTPAEIIRELQKNPSTAIAVTRNKTPVYNLLARLVKRGELVRDGRTYRLPPERDEAPGPSGPSAASHHGGGGGTPSSSGNGEFGLSAALPGANPAHPGE